MTASGQQSFYEIQLSNRHLIVAFLVAVGFGMAIFFLGVVVGRGQPPSPEQGWVESFGPGVSADTAADDFTGLDINEAVEQATASSAPPAEKSMGATEADGSERPAEVVAASPTLPRVSLPRPDPTVPQGWLVQVKSTRRRDLADQLQESLAGDGFPSFVVSTDVDGATYFRVRIGRYTRREDVESVARALDARPDIESTWITRG